MAQGTSALRVLMTDAPLEADNVTFCGIYVEPAVRDGDTSSEERTDERPSGDGVDGEPRDTTSPGSEGTAGAPRGW